MTLAWVAIILSAAYILGSIPFGLIIAKLAGQGDVRQIGSGNIGATNVMRTGRKSLGVLTLLCDAGKGFAAVLLASHLYHNVADFAPLAGLCAVLGHVFPIWLKGKGGKGVATSIGVFFGIDWILGLGVCGVWLTVFLCTRIASLASIASVGYSAIIAYLLGDDPAVLLCLGLAALVVFTHRSNIKRLLHGTEHSFSRKTP